MKASRKRLKGLWPKNGVWQFRYTPRGGKRISVSLQTKDEGEAVSKALKIRDAEPINFKGSLEAAIEEFFRFKKRVGSYTEFSERNKRGDLKRFAENCPQGLRLTHLAPKHIHAFFDLKVDRSDDTKAGYKTVLGSFITWCIDEKNLHMQDCRSALKKYRFRTKARTGYFNPLDIDRALIQSKDDEITYIIICSAFLGMRKNEIINSRKAWYDFEKVEPDCFIQSLDKARADKLGLDPFQIKNERQRRVPLHSYVLEWLKNFVSSKEHYCIAPAKRKGKSPYRYNYDKKYKNFLKKVYLTEFAEAQKCIASHIFRRSFGTNLAVDGVNIGDIADMIGDSIRTTEKHYAQYIPSARTINCMKVGGGFSFTPKSEEAVNV
jgi:integrase